jgi:hypothetical protein
VGYPCAGYAAGYPCTIIIPSAPPPSSPPPPPINGIPVSYQAGYNMAGGPAGANFSGAEALYAYTNGQYVASNGSATPCQGYWAYFGAATTVSIPSTATGPTQSCQLAQGWNLLGNPFSGNAVLPAGLVGFHWNPTTKAYDQVTVIPQGGAVFVYEASATSITLTNQAVPGHMSSVVTITDATQGPVTLHVGDTLQIFMQYSTREVVSYDSQFFTQTNGPSSAPSDCPNQYYCVQVVPTVIWTGTATKAGTTSITFSPLCVANTAQGCAYPQHVVQVTIQ